MIHFHDLREASDEQALGWLSALAEGLRPSDLDEITATTESPPLEALVASIMVSDHAWVITRDGDPVCIFGSAPTGVPQSGMVWMMGTPGMDAPSVALAIGRALPDYLRLLHGTYACLWNHIDARNEKSMRWLSRAGFRVLEALPTHGREGRPFFTFARFDPTHV